MNALLQTLKFLTFDFQVNLLDAIRFPVPAPFKQGMYEVLNFEYSLELLDIEGRQAVIRKREVVRFLQDNIIAYQDQAWGEGELFAEYHCSPGVAVDRYREEQRYRVLISLRETKNRGDVTKFVMDRRVVNGFTRHNEYLQTRIDHHTDHLKLSVIFPSHRLPRKVMLIEQNRGVTKSPGSQQHTELPDGRVEVTWFVRHPRLFELYSIRWEW